MAERAVRLTERREPKALDALAAALAASGRFDAAVETAHAALELGPPETLAAAIRQRQELYKLNRPYVVP